MNVKEVAAVLVEVGKLPTNQRVLVVARFGLVTGSMMSLIDMSERTLPHFTTDQVRQLENQALQELVFQANKDIATLAL